MTLVSATASNFFNLFSGILHNFLDFAQINKWEAAMRLVRTELFVSAIGESFAMQEFGLDSQSLTSHKFRTIAGSKNTG
ncbi:hypothetical protein Q5692_02175 [Microcoleus sp. C2C3]|uniref:hypothetical protein n=1 Tax=unclassified Microcoleus TaxID=2642155 RepID=UPI002FD6CD7A